MRFLCSIILILFRAINHINNATVLIQSSPQVMLFAIDFHEDLIEVEGIAEASLLSLQSASV